jgi:hypothetical protein
MHGDGFHFDWGLSLHHAPRRVQSAVAVSANRKWSLKLKLFAVLLLLAQSFAGCSTMNLGAIKPTVPQANDKFIGAVRLTVLPVYPDDCPTEFDCCIGRKVLASAIRVAITDSGLFTAVSDASNDYALDVWVFRDATYEDHIGLMSIWRLTSLKDKTILAYEIICAQQVKTRKDGSFAGFREATEQCLKTILESGITRLSNTHLIQRDVTAFGEKWSKVNSSADRP